MKNNLNKEVVASIQSRLPQGEGIVPFLMDLFQLAKESVYRRIRGDISFTMEEVACIASKLNFSLDNLIALKNTNYGLFDLILPKFVNPDESYCEKIQNLTQFFAEVRKTTSSKKITFAANYIPYSFSMYLPQFFKFCYYKWIHQSQGVPPDYGMSNVELPQKLVELKTAWREEDRSRADVTYILDKNVFLSAIIDIEYYYKRNLLNDKELKGIQEELFILVNEIERLARSGTTVTGAKAVIYLLQMDLDGNYALFEYDDKECSHIQLYAMDIIQSYSPEVCQNQREWLELLKRYSIMISHSAEMEGAVYFNRQREYILNMGK